MGGAVQQESSVHSDRLYFPSMQPVLTGMPELCRAGLSENWLLKACGHRHWLALAEAHGLARPEFCDVTGVRLYPAFTNLRILDGMLGAVGENQWLDFAVNLQRIGRTSFRSTIAVACDGNPVATVEMDTAFILRTAKGSNTAVRRAVVGRPCRLLPRGPTIRRAAGLLWEPGPQLATVSLDPSPHEDFNGVGFLYFAAFQSLLDRAEWYWFGNSHPVAATHFRHLTFLSNAELGDRVTATLRDERRSASEHRHNTELSRESDGVVIGRAITCRKLQSW